VAEANGTEVVVVAVVAEVAQEDDNCVPVKFAKGSDCFDVAVIVDVGFGAVFGEEKLLGNENGPGGIEDGVKGL